MTAKSPRPVHVYYLDADGDLQSRDMTPAEAEQAMRAYMALARLPEARVS